MLIIFPVSRSHATARRGGAEGREKKEFFFEKKNQKTFAYCVRCRHG
jgi:hypothetical protein